jgi:uncharacterized membrane protein YkoI
MVSRNAWLVIVASALSAVGAAAQQPAKPATTSTHSSTAQAPAAAKKTSKTSTAVALPVSADSARKIVAANEHGATVTSTKLHHKADKAYYAVSYKLKGDSKTMHATVDANTGTFAAAAAPAPAKPAAKKPT